MAIPTVQAVGSASAGIGDITVTLPTHQADDILLVALETNQTTGPAAPSGWAVLAEYAQGSNVTHVMVFWRRATGAGTTNPTFVDPGNHQIGVALVIRGCIATGDPWDYTPSGEGQAGTTTFATTSQTTTVDDCLVFGVIADNTDTASDQMSGEANANLSSFTKQGAFYTTQGNGGGVVVYTGGLATAGSTGSFSGNIATTSSWAGVTFALKPASGDTPISASDTGAAADASTVAADLGATDTGAGADTSSVAATLDSADTGAGADVAALAADLAAADTGSGVDTIAVAAAVDLPDIGAGADDQTIAVDVTLADTAAGVDDLAVSTDTPVSLSDTGSGADDQTVTVDLALTDTGSAVDDLTATTDTLVDLADTGAGADASAVAAAVAATDAATSSEALTVTVTLTTTDTGTLADAADVQATQALLDLLAGVDGLSVTPLVTPDPLGPVAGGPDTPHWAGSAASAGWGGSANGDRWAGGPGFQDIGGGA